MDLHRRSVFKAVSWRIIATFTTTGIAWMVTDSIIFASEIGILDCIIKLIFYYYHERMWNNISFGRIK